MAVIASSTVLQMVKTRSILVSMNILVTASFSPQTNSSLPLRHALEQRENGAQSATIDEFDLRQIEDQGNWTIGEITPDKLL